METKWEINIEPETSIYNIFKRMSYKTETAISEFIDNSTASYFQHRNELKRFNSNYKLQIYVLYNNTGDDKTSSIWIMDNAFGMNEEEFVRAIRINDLPEDRTGRNEFGMGLKTAAIWFANDIMVKSTRFNSGIQYKTTLNTQQLEEFKPKNLIVQTKIVPLEIFGTTIYLKNLDKPLRTRTMKSNLLKLLSSIYRWDLQSGEIEIVCAEYKFKEGKWFDFEGNVYGTEALDYKKIPTIKWNKPELAVLPAHTKYNDSNEEKLLYKEFKNEVKHNGQVYPISGWVGVLKTTSRIYSGFALLRRGRVITGAAANDGYKPKDIFGQSGSFTDIRLIGEVEMDIFPVNQAKDGFSWDDGLQDAFNEVLFEHTKEFKTIAAGIRKHDDANISLIKDDDTISKDNKHISKNLAKITQHEVAIVEEEIKAEDSNFIEHTVIKRTNPYTNLTTLTHFYISTIRKPETWLDISKVGSAGDYQIILYLEHEFLKPHSADKDFNQFMRTFILSFAMSIIFVEENQLGIGSTVDKMNEFFKEYEKDD